MAVLGAPKFDEGQLDRVLEAMRKLTEEIRRYNDSGTDVMEAVCPVCHTAVCRHLKIEEAEVVELTDFAFHPPHGSGDYSFGGPDSGISHRLENEKGFHNHPNLIDLKQCLRDAGFSL